MSVTGLPIPEVGLSVNNNVYNWLFTNVQTPLGSTMYSILAFFITSAAFRAFRARNVESSIVLVAGTIMVMANAPLITNYLPFIADIALWIRSYPNMATFRGVMIGAALGSIALAVRTLMGIERGYLRGGGEE
jgi:predicted metal-binding membrane protein